MEFKNEKELQGIYEVSNLLKTNFPEWYINDYIPIEEDFNLDLTFTAKTDNIEHRYEMEIKTDRYGPYMIGEEVAKNWYACRDCHDNPKSIGNNMRFCDVPPSSMTITQLTEWTTSMTYEEINKDTTPIPENIKNKPIYIINATMQSGLIKKNKYESKGYKIYRQWDRYLTYNMKDGILIFTPKRLRDAYLGYCWYLTTHTTDFKEGSKEKIWELKIILDLSKAMYIKKNLTV